MPAKQTLYKHATTGKTVSTRNRSGDPGCSSAASQWRLGTATHATHVKLAECRAAAKGHVAASLHRAAGNEGRAQHLEHILKSGGPVGPKLRAAKAAEIKASRKPGPVASSKPAGTAAQIAASPGAFSLKQDSAAGHKATSFENAGKGKTSTLFDMKKGDLPGQTSIFDKVGTVEVGKPTGATPGTLDHLVATGKITEAEADRRAAEAIGGAKGKVLAGIHARAVEKAVESKAAGPVASTNSPEPNPEADHLRRQILREQSVHDSLAPGVSKRLAAGNIEDMKAKLAKMEPAASPAGEKPNHLASPLNPKPEPGTRPVAADKILPGRAPAPKPPEVIAKARPHSGPMTDLGSVDPARVDDFHRQYRELADGRDGRGITPHMADHFRQRARHELSPAEAKALSGKIMGANGPRGFDKDQHLDAIHKTLESRLGPGSIKEAERRGYQAIPKAEPKAVAPVGKPVASAKETAERQSRAKTLRSGRESFHEMTKSMADQIIGKVRDRGNSPDMAWHAIDRRLGRERPDVARAVAEHLRKDAPDIHAMVSDKARAESEANPNSKYAKYFAGSKPASDAHAAERVARIAQIRKDNSKALATPSPLDGNISPYQIGRMSARQRKGFEKNLRTKLAAEAEIKGLGRPTEAIQADSRARRLDQIGSTNTQLDRRELTAKQVGVGKGGKLKPSWQKEMDRVAAERSGLAAKAADLKLPAEARKAKADELKARRSAGKPVASKPIARPGSAEDRLARAKEINEARAQGHHGTASSLRERPLNYNRVQAEALKNRVARAQKNVDLVKSHLASGGTAMVSTMTKHSLHSNPETVAGVDKDGSIRVLEGRSGKTVALARGLQTERFTRPARMAKAEELKAQRAAGKPVAAKPLREMTHEEMEHKISSQPASQFVGSHTEDWGSNRGKGKRIGKMVVGAMSDMHGKKSYADPFAKLPDIEEPGVKDEVHSLVGSGITHYTRARAAGLDHEAAMRYTMEKDGSLPKGSTLAHVKGEASPASKPANKNEEGHRPGPIAIDPKYLGTAAEIRAKAGAAKPKPVASSLKPASEVPAEGREFARSAAGKSVDLLNKLRQARYMASGDSGEFQTPKVDRAELKAQRAKIVGDPAKAKEARAALAEVRSEAVQHGFDPKDLTKAGMKDARESFKKDMGDPKTHFLSRGHGIYPGAGERLGKVKAASEAAKAAREKFQAGRAEDLRGSKVEHFAPKPAAPAAPRVKSADDKIGQLGRILDTARRHREGLALRTGTPTSSLYGKNVEVHGRNKQLAATIGKANERLGEVVRSLHAPAEPRVKGKTRDEYINHEIGATRDMRARALREAEDNIAAHVAGTGRKLPVGISPTQALLVQSRHTPAEKALRAQYSIAKKAHESSDAGDRAHHGRVFDMMAGREAGGAKEAGLPAGMAVASKPVAARPARKAPKPSDAPMTFRKGDSTKDRDKAAKLIKKFRAKGREDAAKYNPKGMPKGTRLGIDARPQYPYEVKSVLDRVRNRVADRADKRQDAEFAAPAAPKPFDQSRFEAEFHKAFEGSKGFEHNFTKIHEMRQALPHYSREDFDRGLDAMRRGEGGRKRLYTLDTHEGLRGEIAPHEKGSAIVEHHPGYPDHPTKYHYVARDNPPESATPKAVAPAKPTHAQRAAHYANLFAKASAAAVMGERTPLRGSPAAEFRPPPHTPGTMSGQDHLQSMRHRLMKMTEKAGRRAARHAGR